MVIKLVIKRNQISWAFNLVLTQLVLLLQNFGQYAGLAQQCSKFKFLWYECYGATDAYQSTFIGTSAGFQATNAYNSNFFGQVLVLVQ
jgi:uncharacterized protein (UPF0333 family)